MPIACLPWYDLPEIRLSTDTLWHQIALLLCERGPAEVPTSLAHRADYESQWQNPRLLLGQACGYDVYCANKHELQIVGVPRYSHKGCIDTRYRSFVVVREQSRYRCLSDLRQSRCVINSPQSHSGINVLPGTFLPENAPQPSVFCGLLFLCPAGIGGYSRRLSAIRIQNIEVTMC